MSKIPFSLILDDGCPHMPLAFTKRFVEICTRNGIKGKFSIMPMPFCDGRIDRSVRSVSAEDLKEFLRIAHDDLMPRFSITPEILTHSWLYDMTGGGYIEDLREDVFCDTHSRDEIAPYVGLALEILLSVGLTPSGVTSPWMAGLKNEAEYAAGIGMAFKRVMKKDKCFYFLHCSHDPIKVPTVMCDSAETGLVVTVPAVTGDAFWNTQNGTTDQEAMDNARNSINELLNEDGKTGMIREIADAGKPVTLLTHWQSLFSAGREIGLDGLNTLVERIHRVFGSSMEWLTLEEMAEIRG